MRGRDLWRLIGTAVLTAATAVPYAAGMWSAWVYLYSRLPMPLGILVMLGIAIAPIQLMRDIIDADRVDRIRKEEEKPETE